MRAQAVPDRIGNHSVHRRIGSDLIVAVDLVHLLKAELPRREGPLVVERGIGERSSEFAGQNPRRRADVAHAHADRGNLALLHHLEHPQIVVRIIGHRGNLDDVGVELRHVDGAARRRSSGVLRKLW